MNAKAYVAWDSRCCDPWLTVVFAESASRAKKLAMRTEVCEDSFFTDVRVQRFPEMDGKDRGRDAIDWNDAEDRKALVALGWACEETSGECDSCPEKSNCGNWEGGDEF
jgi:hypothetical protein